MAVSAALALTPITLATGRAGGHWSRSIGGPAMRTSLARQPIVASWSAHGMPRVKDDRVDFVATKRLVLFCGPELQHTLRSST
jgi:hypothetical protein